MKPVQVAPDVFAVTVPTPFVVGPVNLFIIKKGKKVMMVDAGPKTEEAWHVLQDAFKALNIEPEDLEAIVLTHHHPDHTGLIQHFQPDIPVYGHWRLRPWLTHDPNFVERYKQYYIDLSIRMGVPNDYLDKMPTVDQYIRYGGQGILHTPLDEGDSIPGFPEWKVVYTPGHAFSHISLLREEDGLFIAGDVLLENISSNAIVEPAYHDAENAPHTLLQYRDSLKKCMTLPITMVLPGHGDAYRYNDALVTEKLHAQEERRDHILNLIKSGQSTALDIGKAMFRGVWKKQLDLVLSEVQGHLDWLLQDGLVTIQELNGVWHYSVKSESCKEGR